MTDGTEAVMMTLSTIAAEKRDQATWTPDPDCPPTIKANGRTYRLPKPFPALPAGRRFAEVDARFHLAQLYRMKDL